MRCYHHYKTDIGYFTIGCRDDAVTNMVFGERELNGQYCRSDILDKAYIQLTEYLEGRRKNFDLKLCPAGTEFQKRVWKQLCKIDYGKTVSYKDIAQSLGNPGLCRAVGRANNKNPIMIFIPCHRVIGRDGSLTGYAGGLKLKEMLINMEKNNTSPLYRDPVHDGAADPVVVYNEKDGFHYMLYTNRVTDMDCDGVEWIHGTDIGIAKSTDRGKTWNYIGIAKGLEYEKGRNTYWAPEIYYAEGIFHMYVSYVPGVCKDWNNPRYILHYTSEDLINWRFVSKLNLSSDRVIDACVHKKPSGGWRMWYKDEKKGSHTYYADSTDLYNWEVVGCAADDVPHEGANVFYFGNRYWMITDCWSGLDVYYSHDLEKWTKQKTRILQEPGRRKDDGAVGNHADVYVTREQAYIFYFTHPERKGKEIKNKNERRTSIQAARLCIKNGELYCDRNEPGDIILFEENEH